MSLKENLIAARVLIDTPRKWRKDGKLGGGRLCAVNALIEACGAENTSGGEVAVCAVIGADDSSPFVRRELIADYNDRPATTHADIMALFDRAIESASAPRSTKGAGE